VPVVIPLCCLSDVIPVYVGLVAGQRHFRSASCIWLAAGPSVMANGKFMTDLTVTVMVFENGE
jgi:hypothetical protein